VSLRMNKRDYMTICCDLTKQNGVCAIPNLAVRILIRRRTESPNTCTLHKPRYR